MTRSLILSTLAATSILAAPTTQSWRDLDPASRTMLNLRVVGAVLGSYKEAYGSLPELGLKPVESSRVIDELRTELGTELRKVLSADDGWGNPLRFVVTHDHYMIISLGADGRLDAETAADAPERDIIYSDGEFAQRPQPKVSPTKQAMADLRTIGTAIESFAVDNDRYPGPTMGLQTIDAFSGDLESIYIRRLPRLDGWGYPYLVWSDTRTYFAISTGADGALDRDYLAFGSAPAELAKEPAASSDPNADVVFADGQFTQWPSDGEHP